MLQVLEAPTGGPREEPKAQRPFTARPDPAVHRILGAGRESGVEGLRFRV